MPLRRALARWRGPLAVGFALCVIVMVAPWPCHNITAQSNLQYELVYATTSSLGTLSGAQAGSVAASWSANIGAGSISGLVVGTRYYVNVMVEDQVGNIGLYAQTSLVAELDSPYKTALSPQRKTFSSQGVDWAFWFGGELVHYGLSTDHGATWNELGTLPISTWRYSVAEKDGSAFIAYESSNDIYVRRASLTSSSATWDTAVLALDASGASDAYSRPSVTIGNDDALYMAAYRLSNGAFNAYAAQSTSTYDAALGFSTPAAIGVASSSAGELALIPQGSAAMLVMNQNGVNMEAYQCSGSSWQKAASNVSDWFSIGQQDFNNFIFAVAVIGSDIYVGGDSPVLGPMAPATSQNGTARPGRPWEVGLIALSMPLRSWEVIFMWEGPLPQPAALQRIT